MGRAWPWSQAGSPQHPARHQRSPGACGQRPLRLRLVPPPVPAGPRPRGCWLQRGLRGSRRVKLVERLPNDSLWLVLDHVSSHPQSLLALPPHRRTALARRALQLLVRAGRGGGSAEGAGDLTRHALPCQRSPLEPEIPGEVLDLLGPLLGFLDRDSAARIRPESLLLRLETLQGACLSDEFAATLGQLLLSRRALG